MKRLFELEVPELQDGVVELKAVAREPGHRTKIAVASNDSNVDPVGACVGARGLRVRQVVNELRGEKVDIVPFVDNPSELVMKALAPAKVREVRIHEDTGIAEVIVPDFQLSLAIGKEGQNARLAARLTGWRVDIKSETQLAEEESGEFFAEGEWVEGPDGELMWQPEGGGDAISAADAGYAGATAADLAAAAAAPPKPPPRAAAASSRSGRHGDGRWSNRRSRDQCRRPSEAEAARATGPERWSSRHNRDQCRAKRAKRMRMRPEETAATETSATPEAKRTRTRP